MEEKRVGGGDRVCGGRGGRLGGGVTRGRGEVVTSVSLARGVEPSGGSNRNSTLNMPAASVCKMINAQLKHWSTLRTVSKAW